MERRCLTKMEFVNEGLMKNNIGIYKITNLINGKIYIGKTLDTIEKRWKDHKSDSVRPRCEKRPLYSAMNKL